MTDKNTPLTKINTNNECGGEICDPTLLHRSKYKVKENYNE